MKKGVTGVDFLSIKYCQNAEQLLEKKTCFRIGIFF